MNRDAKGAELSRLAQLSNAHEEANNLPQRGYVYSSGPVGGSDKGRHWVFGKDVRMSSIDSALTYQRQICREYGIEV